MEPYAKPIFEFRSSRPIPFSASNEDLQGNFDEVAWPDVKTSASLGMKVLEHHGFSPDDDLVITLGFFLDTSQNTAWPRCQVFLKNTVDENQRKLLTRDLLQLISYASRQSNINDSQIDLPDLGLNSSNEIPPELQALGDEFLLDASKSKLKTHVNIIASGKPLAIIGGAFKQLSRVCSHDDETFEMEGVIDSMIFSARKAKAVSPDWQAIEFYFLPEHFDDLCLAFRDHALLKLAIRSSWDDRGHQSQNLESFKEANEFALKP